MQAGGAESAASVQLVELRSDTGDRVDAVFEIVGVTSDAKNQGLQDSPMPEILVPYTLTGAFERGKCGTAMPFRRGIVNRKGRKGQSLIARQPQKPKSFGPSSPASTAKPSIGSSKSSLRKRGKECTRAGSLRSNDTGQRTRQNVERPLESRVPGF